ncbi:MAG: protein translocase subunit SecD [Rhodopirellula sp.]|nr:protein translocase subunit SecD [Rhodopirellula sp.]
MPWYANLLIVLAILILPVVLGTWLARRWRMPEYATRIGVVLFCLFAGIAITWSGWPPKLGIDLRGGVILVYEVDEDVKVTGPAEEEVPDAATAGGAVDMDKLIAAVARRVNPGGVKEVTIREYGPKQIEIIIPEADEAEVERMKRIISSVGTLEFRILANQRDHKALIERALAEDSQKLLSGDGKLLAWWVPVTKGEENSFATYNEIATRTRERRGDEFLEILVVKDDFDVTGGYLTRAVSDVDQRGRPCVRFFFNAAGGRLFSGLTSNNLPDEVQEFTRKLGIVLDGYLYSAPSIQSTISQQGEITGEFTKQEVQDLVDVLNAGSLPAALSKEPISQLATGPTLGRDTIRRGSIAIALSLAVVVIFMTVYYRFAGLVASAAVLMNMIMLVAIMITIKAPFSLPGLAGLALTLGMAVDANVLIFERMREELDRAATLRMAIRNGFSKAMSAIIDSNLTTLITATILYVIGTDQIKGFAVTLWLGIVLSMFTGIYCARTVFDIAERRRWITKLRMMRMLTRTNIDFIGKWRIAATGSVLLIVVGMAAVFARGQGLLDIDFTGGVSVEVVFNESQPIGEVRTSLKDLPDLVVVDVQVAGEPRERRFIINTSSPPDTKAEQYLEEVKTRVQEVFGDKLSTNTIKNSEIKQIAPGKVEGNVPGSPPEAKPTTPEPDTQSGLFRGAVPTAVSGLLSSTALGKAAEPSQPSSEKADAEKPTAAKPAAEKPAVEKPAAEKPAAEKPPAEKPVVKESAAKAPATPAETMPAEKPSVPVEKTPSETAPKTEAAAAVPKAVDRFAGGTAAKLEFSHRIDYDTLSELFQKIVPPTSEFDLDREGFEEGDTAAYLDWTVRIQAPPEKAEQIVSAVKGELDKTPFFPSASTIGGKVAGSTRVQAIYALLASLLCIIVYIWVRFQRIVYGLAAVIALVHDVLITLGCLALSLYLAPFFGFLLINPFKIGLSELAAFLTVIGYSLNDTIVVFDRIREVRGKSPRLTMQMVNDSVNQTLSRTILTGLTTMIVLVILYVGGGNTIHGFSFVLLVGVIVGTFSSIFVASPVVLWMSRSELDEPTLKRPNDSPQVVS